jgi:DMSO reductase family type II enzyme heme b subunit
VSYIKGFSRFFEQLGEPTPLAFGAAPRLSEEALAEGRRFYDEIECFKCHGELGLGDGPSAPTLQDDLDFPIRAADLTENWNFNGGGSVEDIYRTLRTGLDGSPMPSFSDLIDAGFMTDEQLWHLAQYVRSLAPDRPPRVREVIGASRIETELPSSSDDPVWDEIEARYIPLVGQIIEEPRWFAPTVDGVWVQAVHDERELVLRVVWHDPSRSPDPTWLEWQGWIASAMYPLADSIGAGPLPDRLVVQFPATVTAGRERPYFLMGDSRRPVYLWRWTSEPEGAVEMRATGLGSQQPLSEAGGSLEWNAVWDRGEWRVVFKRALDVGETGTSPGFPLGQAVPIAFFAWDGSSGERGSRAGISSWYNIYLEKSTPATVYVSPALAALLTAGLGILVVWRAQRRENEASSQP